MFISFWLIIVPTVTVRKLVKSFKKVVITLKIISVFVRVEKIGLFDVQTEC